MDSVDGIWTCDCEYASCIVVVKPPGGHPDTCTLSKECIEVNFIKSES